MPKKLFISQPMRGKSKEEILAVREKAIASAYRHFGEGEKPLVIDSYFEDAPAGATPLWYLAKSLELLSTADVAYFAAGWENARGCRIENACAIEYGIDVIEDYSDVHSRAGGQKTCGPDWEAEAQTLAKRAHVLTEENEKLRIQNRALADKIAYLNGFKDAVKRIFSASE